MTNPQHSEIKEERIIDTWKVEICRTNFGWVIHDEKDHIIVQGRTLLRALRQYAIGWYVVRKRKKDY